MLHFARTLSQYYQGLAPLDPPPDYTYERVSLNSVNPKTLTDIPLPDIKHVYSMRETAPHNDPIRITPVQLTLRLKAAQIKRIHAAAQEEIRRKDPRAFLSRQDVLAALIAYSLSHAEPDMAPVQNIISILMVCVPVTYSS